MSCSLTRAETEDVGVFVLNTGCCWISVVINSLLDLYIIHPGADVFVSLNI